MAYRPNAYGLTAEVNAKIKRKYDIGAEREALDWIAQVLEQPTLFHGISGENDVQEALKDGTILCNLINCIAPCSIRKINEKKLPFLMMENIGNFLTACEQYGLKKQDLFQTSDLYDKQNMHNVILTIHALGRKAQMKGYYGPALGPRESQQNIRLFSQDVLKEGRSVIGLQMGTNKGANQSGVNFGKSRSILD